MYQYYLDFDSDVQGRGLFISSKSDDMFLIEEMCPEWALFQLVLYKSKTIMTAYQSYNALQV